jgi:hypothetical protein
VVRRGYSALQRSDWGVALVVCEVQEFVTLQRSDFDVRDGQMADRLVVGKKQCLSSLWNRIIGKGDCCFPPST